MTDKLKQIATEEIAKIKPEIQNAINAFDWISISGEIGKKYLIDEDEISSLQVETLLVLVGLTDPDLFVKNIEDNVGTSHDEAEKIANEILNRVFVPINEKALENIRKSLHEKNPDFRQNVDFIVSGGDYAVLAAEPKTENVPLSSREHSGEKRKVEDIKSKFVI